MLILIHGKFSIAPYDLFNSLTLNYRSSTSVVHVRSLFGKVNLDKCDERKKTKKMVIMSESNRIYSV